MVSITYIEHDGTSHVVDVEEGRSVMEGAIQNNIPGIVAECGGACSCATCNAYVDEQWFEKVGPAGGDEADMLEFVDNPAENSRLTCQIEVIEDLDGLIVCLPEGQ